MLLGTILVVLGAALGLLLRTHLRLRADAATRELAAARSLEAARAAAAVARTETEQAQRQCATLRDSLHALPVPLSAALGSAERLLMQSGEHPTLRRETTALTDNLQELLARVGDLLQSVELERADVQLDLRTLDMAALLRGVCAHYGLHAVERRQHLECNAPHEMPVRGELARLREALEQSVAHGLRASPAGTVVSVWLEREEDYAVLRVLDRGPALGAASAEHLFRRSPRVTAGGSAEASLWLVRRVAELHAGSARLVTDEQGNQLVVRIPLADVQQAVEPGGQR